MHLDEGSAIILHPQTCCSVDHNGYQKAGSTGKYSRRRVNFPALSLRQSLELGITQPIIRMIASRLLLLIKTSG
jgi:hypothetical protein